MQIVISMIEDESNMIFDEQEYEQFIYEINNDYHSQFFGFINLIDYNILGDVDTYIQRYHNEYSDIIDEVRDFTSNESTNQFINSSKKLICYYDNYNVFNDILEDHQLFTHKLIEDLSELFRIAEYNEMIEQYICDLLNIKSNIESALIILEEYNNKLIDLEDNQYMVYAAITDYIFDI